MSKTDRISVLRSLALSLLISLISILAAPYIPGLNGIILGLLLAMLLANVRPLSARWTEGLSTVSGKGLEWAIVFIAFGINYSDLSGGQAGAGILLLVILIIAVLLLSTALYIRFRPNADKLSWLIGFGTAICGSSAIAALAPTLEADEEDTAISIAVVNLIGTLGMIVLPLLLYAAGSGTAYNAFFIGAGLHSIGNVGGAAYAMGDAVGELAIAVKLARVAMLTPALILLNLAIHRSKGGNWRTWIRLPWFLILFILISIAASFLELPDELMRSTSFLSKFLLTLAMTAIGLKINIASLWGKARRGLGFGMLLFGLQLTALLGILWVIL